MRTDVQQTRDRPLLIEAIEAWHRGEQLSHNQQTMIDEAARDLQVRTLTQAFRDGR